MSRIVFYLFCAAAIWFLAMAVVLQPHLYMVWNMDWLIHIFWGLIWLAIAVGLVLYMIHKIKKWL